MRLAHSGRQRTGLGARAGRARARLRDVVVVRIAISALAKSVAVSAPPVHPRTTRTTRATGATGAKRPQLLQLVEGHLAVLGDAVEYLTERAVGRKLIDLVLSDRPVLQE